LPGPENQNGDFGVAILRSDALNELRRFLQYPPDESDYRSLATSLLFLVTAAQPTAINRLTR
jgi:hypothetical protein